MCVCIYIVCVCVCGVIFKVFVEFVTVLLLFYVLWVFGWEACGILALWPGIESDSQHQKAKSSPRSRFVYSTLLKVGMHLMKGDVEGIPSQENDTDMDKGVRCEMLPVLKDLWRLWVKVSVKAK